MTGQSALKRINGALWALKPDVKKPWVKLDGLPYIHATDNPNAKAYSTPVVGRFDYMESADYIMACNPAAMSEIIIYVDTLKAQRDELLEALTLCYDHCRLYHPDVEKNNVGLAVCTAIAKTKETHHD